MRVIIQRVSEASVTIDGAIHSQIGNGLLLFLGICDEDSDEDIEWLVKKITQLRIFNDQNGVMNLSVQDVNGAIIVVSQFTLFASTKKGNRPSYIKAAKPPFAIPLYKKFVQTLKLRSGLDIQTGSFGADMKVKLLNDGPVTIIMDSKNKE